MLPCVNSNSTKTSNPGREKNHTGSSFLKILNNKERFNSFIGRMFCNIQIEIDQNPFQQLWWLSLCMSGCPQTHESEFYQFKLRTHNLKQRQHPQTCRPRTPGACTPISCSVISPCLLLAGQEVEGLLLYLMVDKGPWFHFDIDVHSVRASISLFHCRVRCTELRT